MLACRVISPLTLSRLSSEEKSSPGIAFATLGLSGRTVSTSRECTVAALRIVIACNTEMPIDDPILRISVNIAVPSLRYLGASVAKAIVDRGTKMRPVQIGRAHA